MGLWIVIIGALAGSFAAETSWLQVKTGDSSSGFRITGHIIPQDGALHLDSARVQGRVLSVLKREGDHVVPGTPILSISSAECLSLTEEKKVAKQRDLPELSEAVAKREAQLGVSVKGDQCDLVAQKSGTITKRSLENGSSFAVGDPIVTILETSKLSAELDLPEQSVSHVFAGQKVSLELASAPGIHVISKVLAIVPAVDPTNRTVKVRIRPVSFPKGTTLDSLVFGQLDVGTKEQILVAPTTAIVFDEGKNWVVKQASPEPVKVQVQLVNETESVSSIRPVNSGELKAGDLVAGSGAIFFFKK